MPPRTTDHAIGKALVKVVERAMGDEWNDGIKEAWTKVWLTMAKTMRLGAAEGPASTDSQIESVRRTWAIVMEDADGNAIEFFKGAADALPGFRTHACLTRVTSLLCP